VECSSKELIDFSLTYLGYTNKYRGGIMKTIPIIFILFFITVSTISAKDYTKKSEVRAFINEMVHQHKFDKRELTELFSTVRFQKKALAVYVRALRPVIKRPKNYKPPKKQGSWDRYEAWLLKDSRVQRGVQYMKEYNNTLQRAYRKYGVPPEYITAIIGIESYYGKNTGKFPVFDTLTTLAFEENRRNKFFRSELKAFLLMTKREGVNPKPIMGSIAGAIGLGQFMPSNYKTLAVDFNRDGKKRMNNHEDAIGSIAHYFKRSGWKKDREVAVRVEYEGNRYRGRKTGYKHKHHRSALKGIAPIRHFNYKDKVHLIKLKRLSYDELWYGTRNFYAITRYNHSNYYAMAVHQLAQKIKKSYNRSRSHSSILATK